MTLRQKQYLLELPLVLPEGHHHCAGEAVGKLVTTLTKLTQYWEVIHAEIKSILNINVPSQLHYFTPRHAPAIRPCGT